MLRGSALAVALIVTVLVPALALARGLRSRRAFATLFGAESGLVVETAPGASTKVTVRVRAPSPMSGNARPTMMLIA